MIEILQQQSKDFVPSYYYILKAKYHIIYHISFITPQLNFFCISQQSLAGNNLINLPLPFTTGDRWDCPPQGVRL